MRDSDRCYFHILHVEQGTLFPLLRNVSYFGLHLSISLFLKAPAGVTNLRNHFSGPKGMQEVSQTTELRWGKIACVQTQHWLPSSITSRTLKTSKRTPALLSIPDFIHSPSLHVLWHRMLNSSLRDHSSKTRMQHRLWKEGKGKEEALTYSTLNHQSWAP